MASSSATAGIRGVAKGELLELIRSLRRYATALVGSRDDADDLVQETLKRALLYFDGERQIDNLRAYLFRILHNARNDMLKQRMRAGRPVEVDESRLVSNDLAQVERFACHQVVAAMRELSEEHRQVLLLIGVEGMSYRDAADILGVPIGTVMSRLNRARLALRELVDIGSVMELDGRP